MRFEDRMSLNERLTRRKFLRLSLCGGGACLLPWNDMPLLASPLDDSRVGRMEFEVLYSTHVASVPKRSKKVMIWMPLPPSSGDQTIEGFGVMCPVPYEIRSEHSYKNRLLFIETEPDSVPFTVESRYRVVRRQSRVTPATLEDEAREKYVSLSSRVRITDDIRTFTDDVVGGERSASAIGRKVFDAIIDILIYDKQIAGCGTGDTEWIFKHRRGKCDDYHSLFMAMMISRGIPVRWEQGFPLPYASAEQLVSGEIEGDCSGAHCWVSFYDPDRGWVPVDVSEADKRHDLREYFFGNLTPNRFKISEGRSIVLEPKQAGDPLNSFAYAYAEADGIPLIYTANYKNTISFAVKRIEMI